MLIVRTDGRIVEHMAGDLGSFARNDRAGDISGQFLTALWPEQVAEAVRGRVRDAVRRRSVSRIEATLPDNWSGRVHEITILAHGRDRAQVLARDVSGKATLDKEVRELAFRDSMTQLPNRAAFVRELGGALNTARLTGRSVALLRIHLRGLDYINRTFGRHNGSQLVGAMAQRLADSMLGSNGLRAHVAQNCTLVLARTEGNEYSLMVDGCADTEQLKALARDVIARLGAPEPMGGDEVSLDTCIGIARFPHDAEDLEALQAHAGVALYDARKNTASAIASFTSTAQVRSLSRLDIAQELRWALENNQFDLVYQPTFDQRTHRVMSAEALLRWEHPLRGEVPLGEIIPIAQMNDLSTALGDWVMEHAIADAAALHDSAHWTISLNLFARQSFAPSLVERATTLAQHYGLDPQRIDFEIRAADFHRDVAASETTTRALREAGFGVTLDDCGMHALSPRSILRTGIGRIKLSRQLIERLPEEGPRRVVAAHLALADALGIRVCATGVETPAHANCLEELGCRYVQGFHFYRPESFDSLVERARQQVALA
ncbi:MAG: EAL domain-containing protein [Gammaproteobacteria bacterium]